MRYKLAVLLTVLVLVVTTFGVQAGDGPNVITIEPCYLVQGPGGEVYDYCPAKDNSIFIPIIEGE
ncbi:exported hypothetical protein [Gammaproteobacteria bacterium]